MIVLHICVHGLVLPQAACHLEQVGKGRQPEESDAGSFAGIEYLASPSV